MRFAHFADAHLGFQKDRSLQKVEERAFEHAVGECISRNVDFVLMCGDMFHTNIPEMRVQKAAMEQFRRLHDASIPVYAVYGSHDFSPVSNSFIDLLVSANFMKKMGARVEDDNKVLPEFTVDEKTGAKLAGLSGQKVGRDAEYYDLLDREKLESEPGFRIFMFHGAVRELVGGHEGEGGFSASRLPGGFDYYAGGHIHAFADHRSIEGRDHIVYPGTLLAGYHSDMEESARGRRRGFVVVDFEDDGVKGVELVEVPGCAYDLVEVDADGRSSEAVNREVSEKVDAARAADRAVVLRVGGELSAGRVTDIDLGAARKTLLQNGALAVMVHRRSLSSAEYKIRGEHGDTPDEIMQNTFQDNIGQVRLKRDNLTGERGVALAQSLFSSMRNPRPDNEKKADYEYRVRTDAVAKMGLE